MRPHRRTNSATITAVLLGTVAIVGLLARRRSLTIRALPEPPPLPKGHLKLMEFALASIRDCASMNLRGR